MAKTSYHIVIFGVLKFEAWERKLKNQLKPNPQKLCLINDPKWNSLYLDLKISYYLYKSADAEKEFSKLAELLKFKFK